MVDYFLLLIPKEPVLTKTQLQTIVDICIGIGLVTLGSVAIPVFLDRGSKWTLLIGIVASLGFW